MSEQQFAASLEITEDKPQFEIDEVEKDASPETAVCEVASEILPAAESSLTQQTVAVDSECASRDSSTQSRPSAADAEVDWRHLVSAKVRSYKARKPHKEHYPSLKLQFDPPPERAVRQPEPVTRVEEVREVAQSPAESSGEPVFIAPPPLPDPPPRIVMEATARVIEFPRPARADELADPVIQRPRIVEAPELLPPPPAMGGILIEEQQEPEYERRPGFDVPLQSASLNRRIAAWIFDVALVMAAVALFGYVFLRINGGMPPLRSAVVLAASLIAIFWPAYQYAFLVFSGRTPGLWAARLHLSRFDGQPVSRSLRRWRALVSVLSLASLGLGYAWCFFDEDQLSWHDRITRTHPAPN